MRRPALAGPGVAFAIAFLLAGASPRGGGAEGADPEARTAHVRARGDVPPDLLRELADLGEAGWPHWKAYFRAEPSKNRLPLEMVVSKDRESFVAATKGLGVDLSSAGGWYDAGARTSYLFLQPHLSSTRLLVLHELTHQYQYKALQDDVPDRSPVWHREGLAEHFGFHRRTKAGLEVGALDVVAIDARPTECADLVRAGKLDAWGIATGTRAKPPDYTESLAIVEALLRTKDETLQKAFAQWEREIYRGGNAARRFEKLFAGKRERLEAAVREVWHGFSRKWNVVYVSWDEKDDAIVGRGAPWAVLAGGKSLPEGRRFVEAEVSVAADATSGGVGLGYRGTEDLVAATVAPDGRVTLSARKKGSWMRLGDVAAPEKAVLGPVHLRLEARGTGVTLDIGGVRALAVEAVGAGLSTVDFEGPAALFAEGGEVRFEKVKTGAGP